MAYQNVAPLRSGSDILTLLAVTNGQLCLDATEGTHVAYLSFQWRKTPQAQGELQFFSIDPQAVVDLEAQGHLEKTVEGGQRSFFALTAAGRHSLIDAFRRPAEEAASQDSQANVVPFAPQPA